MTTGEKIKQYRKSKGLTLNKLGILAGFTNRGDVRIAQYENGSRIPGPDILCRIADALEVSVEELAGAPCRGCPYRKMKQCNDVVIHLDDDSGYETETRSYEDPDDEGLLYDNLD